jgi:hypothetical protein
MDRFRPLWQRGGDVRLDFSMTMLDIPYPTQGY